MIQININKPTSCDDCPLCVDYDCIIHNRVTHEYYDGSQEQYWHCPIVEPEQKHGDVVEVVRCKDCTNWQSSWHPMGVSNDCHYCATMDTYMKADDFCSYGEKDGEA